MLKSVLDIELRKWFMFCVVVVVIIITWIMMNANLDIIWYGCSGLCFAVGESNACSSGSSCVRMYLCRYTNVHTPEYIGFG